MRLDWPIEEEVATLSRQLVRFDVLLLLCKAWGRGGGAVLTLRRRIGAMRQAPHVGPRLSAVAMVCIPVNVGDRHWMCLVVHPPTRRILAMDSLGRTAGVEVAVRILNW